MAFRSRLAPGVGAALLLVGAVTADQSPTAADEILSELQVGVAGLNSVLTYPAGSAETRLAALVDAHVDLSGFMDRTFGRYVERTVEDYRRVMSRDAVQDLAKGQEKLLARAMRGRIAADLDAWVQSGQVRSVTLGQVSYGSDAAEVTLRGDGPGGATEYALRLEATDQGWRIQDVRVDGENLSRSYRNRYRDIVDERFSVSVLTARLEDREFVSLEDFATTPAGSFPRGWGWRQKDDHKPKLYEVRGDGERRHLAAVDTGSSVILLKYAHWDPLQYPIMTWCWRADALPPNGDERYTPTNDSAAGWYVIFSQNWLGIPRQIKYVWSTTLPVGTVDRRDMWARPYFFVVESGDERLGQWTFEEVDIEASYRRVYGSPPKDRTLGIGLLTDANSTDSRAEALYADLRVWPRAAAGRIVNYCSCLEDAK